jgi:hypothetical protein
MLRVEHPGTCRLVDVLGEWGAHSSERGLGRKVTDILDAVDFALTYYSDGPRLIGRIFMAEPIACLRVKFTAADLPRIITHRGTPLDAVATAKQTDPLVRTMVDSPEPVRGPLICTCPGEYVGDHLQLPPPFVLVDGWHRGSAWVLHGRAERVYPIAGRIIVTRRPLPSETAA